MYDLSYHKERDADAVRAFMAEHPFAFLTGCDAERQPVATQVPVFFEDNDGAPMLSGHIMKNTDHHKCLQHNDNVLVVFTGPHTYVSGSWYSDPHTPSTWNYMSVHVRGKIRFLEGDAIARMLRKTSLHFEGQNTTSPTVYDNLPPELIKEVTKMIVAFEIDVTSIDNVFKLSQDRDHESYRNIIDKLQAQDESGRAIAAAMQARIGDVFPETRNDA